MSFSKYCKFGESTAAEQKEKTPLADAEKTSLDAYVKAFEKQIDDENSFFNQSISIRTKKGLSRGMVIDFPCRFYAEPCIKMLKEKCNFKCEIQCAWAEQCRDKEPNMGFSVTVPRYERENVIASRTIKGNCQCGRTLVMWKHIKTEADLKRKREEELKAAKEKMSMAEREFKRAKHKMDEAFTTYAKQLEESKTK